MGFARRARKSALSKMGSVGGIFPVGRLTRGGGGGGLSRTAAEISGGAKIDYRSWKWGREMLHRRGKRV